MLVEEILTVWEKYMRFKIGNRYKKTIIGNI